MNSNAGQSSFLANTRTTVMKNLSLKTSGATSSISSDSLPAGLAYSRRGRDHGDGRARSSGGSPPAHEGEGREVLDRFEGEGADGRSARGGDRGGGIPAQGPLAVLLKLRIEKLAIKNGAPTMKRKSTHLALPLKLFSQKSLTMDFEDKAPIFSVA